MTVGQGENFLRDSGKGMVGKMDGPVTREGGLAGRLAEVLGGNRAALKLPLWMISWLTIYLSR